MSVRKHLFCAGLVLAVATGQAIAQPYYQAVYPVAAEHDVVVGTTENYCGYGFELSVSIYKPVGDGNMQRPVIICAAPGGPWSKYDPNDASIDSFAVSFARRGYVGVRMNYRRGIHLYPFGPGLPTVNNLLLCGYATALCGYYPADHGELQRGVYRASQDLRSVVRFMKSRHEADSTCTSNVFLMGHSGGGVVSLYAALLDDMQERPAACGAAAPVQNPQWEDLPFQPCGPANKDSLIYSWWNSPGDDFELPQCYQRPDLGGIEGSLFPDSPHDGSVLGVAALAGGIMLSDSVILGGSQETAVFLYHQVNDYITPFGVDTMARCFAEHFDLVSPRNMQYLPVVGGSGWLNGALQARNWAGGHRLWAYADNQQPPDIPLVWCAANHDFRPSWQQVMDSIALFFSEKIQSFGGCVSLQVDEETAGPGPSIFPNPAGEVLNIGIPGPDGRRASIEVFDALGRLRYAATAWGSKSIPTREITAAPGLYWVRIAQEGAPVVSKAVLIAP